jgi:chorismate mutase
VTQSGQGEEPSARPAREGIVLPSDGGEPLLPGMTATPAPAGPAGGQGWGGSWGPEQQAPQQGQGWPPAAPQWSGSEQPPAATGPGPLPPEGAPAPSYGGQAPGYDGQAPGYDGQAPAYGGQAPSYGQPPAHGPGGQAGPGAYGAAQQPAYGTPDPYQQHQQHGQQQYPAQPAAPLPDAYPATGAPLPPTADAATQYIPPVPNGPGGSGGLVHEGATQYLPPVQAAPADGATQYIPPVTGHEDATRYIPPVTSGPLPPESAGEETRYLGQVPRQAAPAPSDAEATQYIPPYAGQAQGADRQPPAEFDNLFRGGPTADDSPAGSTQQLPRVQQPDAYPGPAQSSYRPAQPSYDAEPDGGGRRGGRSRVPLIAAMGVGLIVVGVGAGALLSGGGGKDQGGDGKDQTVAATSPATQDSASPAVDPARQQAVELDKVLADSGSSRASVIQAVADVKQCDNLDQAAGNLRDAARQRNELVARLGRLTTDKLHAQGQLRDALTKAWQASAAADNHYAAWAGQAKSHKVCRKGHARVTNETQAGNRESGTASEQKAKAAALWNTIAQKYGLTQRQPTQL